MLDQIISLTGTLLLSGPTPGACWRTKILTVVMTLGINFSMRVPHIHSLSLFGVEILAQVNDSLPEVIDTWFSIQD